MLLFALLTAWSIATLKGTLLAVALVIIGGLAAKSYVHFVRARLEADVAEMHHKRLYAAVERCAKWFERKRFP